MEGTGQPLRRDRGDILFRPGEVACSLYRAETGLLRLTELTQRGRTVTVRHILPGDFFGEEALTCETYRHQAEVLIRSSLRRFEPSDLSGSALRSLLESLGGQLQRLVQAEYDLQTADLRQRIVRYLLELADTPLGSEDPDNRLYVRATHELLAEGTRSTRESVSKVITDLRAAGWIESGYRHITLLDLPALMGLLHSSQAVGAQ